MKYVMIFLVLLTVGCAGTPQTRATNSLGVVCSSYATALDELVKMRDAGKLDTAQRNRITSVNNSVKPVCGKDSAFDPALGVGLVESAIAALKGIK